MTKQYYRQILTVFLITIVLMVCILLATVTYTGSYYDEVNRNTIERIKYDIDMRIEEIHNIAFQMYSSEKLPVLAYTEDIFSAETMEKTLEYQKTLEKFSMYNQYVRLNFTVFPKSNYVLMPESGQDLESFAKKFSDSEYPDGFDGETFTAALLNRNFSFAKDMWYKDSVYDQKTAVLPYVKWSRTGTTEKNAAIVVLLDIAELQELLSQSLATDASLLCVINEENHILASSRGVSDEEYEYIMELTGREQNRVRGFGDFTGYSRSSGNLKLQYVLLASHGSGIGSVEILILLIVIVCVSCLLIVAGGVFAFMRRNQHLFESIIGTIAPEEKNMKHQDAYQRLNRNIQKMLTDRKELDERLHDQNTAIREVYLNNLLRGDILDDNNYRQVLFEWGFFKSGVMCCVAIASLHMEDAGRLTDTDIQKIKSIITQVAHFYSGDVVSCNIGKLESALIFLISDSEEKKDYQKKVEHFYESLSRMICIRYKIRITFSVGGLHAGDDAAPVSFSEARLSCSSPDSVVKEGIFWYSGTAKESSVYYYPAELEMQFINAIRSGNTTMVEEITRSLFNTNLREKQIDYDFLIAFLYEFYGSVLKVIKSSEISEEKQREIYQFFANNIRNIDSLDVQQQFLKYIYLLTNSFKDNKKSHNQTLISQIIKYIEENYDDYNLALGSVADEFHISSGYLSSFFREQAGVTFSEFLLNVRMKRALEMVTDTTEQINTIAQGVGYGSANTFCRVFRKFYGSSPSEIRKQGRVNQSETKS